ncbi:cation:proton antiporter [Sinomonas sp. JGH33]|uniref:Cation:proton antiporter n=1 Tax=Sinomonas terricola TaxID=3110330 RepID=A0ABU5T6J1_9MICC|nr:cation:proton antiporter [Sinomonas sp. JGH33]MEA5455142.1 cation:proton antiporter [Sinomonas sp. JGH33]
MNDVAQFGLVVLVVALAALAAVMSNRVSTWLRIPAPVIFLLCAAGASAVFPELGQLSPTAVQRVVTVALVVVLFDGGMHIGWERFRSAAWPVLWIGVVGTFVTAGGLALAAHLLFGLDWTTALVLGTALSPTDPAVVFSVLGRREVTGRTGVILEGESGANDPVGIALMVSLLASSDASGIDLAGVARDFLMQMTIGGIVGIVGGKLLVIFMRRVQLPNEGLYALRTLASALALYGIATVANGSGFLAVFVAGIIVGDEGAPYKADIKRFHASLSSIGEIVVFVILGLTVDLRTLPEGNAWLIGLGLAVLLAVLIRPVFAGLVLLPVKLTRGERIFVLWSGLKGAVPILLGTFVFESGLPGTTRIYDIIFVVVAFSVLVQGGLVPWVAARCKVSMHTVEPTPWGLGLRFREPPQGLRRYRIAPGATADGQAIQDLGLGEGVWISFVLRRGQPVHVRSSTILAAGDEVLLLVDPEEATDPQALFTVPRAGDP